MKTVTVDSNDPTKVNTPAASNYERSPTATVQANQASEKSDVVFEATAATVQELVLSHQYRYFFRFTHLGEQTLLVLGLRSKKWPSNRWCLSSRQD
jgi:hypothetical protein